MHHVGTLAQTAASPGTYDARSEGYSRHILFGPEQGSVHQCVAVCELAPGGRVDRHFHVFEEGLYVLAGLLTAFDERLAADDFLFVEAGAALDAGMPLDAGARGSEAPRDAQADANVHADSGLQANGGYADCRPVRLGRHSVGWRLAQRVTTRSSRSDSVLCVVGIASASLLL